MPTIIHTQTTLYFWRESYEAAQFYCSLFPGSFISRVNEFPDNVVSSVVFYLNGLGFCAMDRTRTESFSPRITFQLVCANQEEIDYYWSRLAQGGQEERGGWVTDRFGIHWHVVPQYLKDLLCSTEPLKAERATLAVQNMYKIRIRVLEEAVGAVFD